MAFAEAPTLAHKLYAACAQAFCRVAAVAGATYVLRHPVSTLLFDPISRSCVGVRTSAGQILRCEALAADAVSLAGLEHLPENRQSSSAGTERVRCSIARAVCIIDGPLQVSFVQFKSE